MKKPPKSTPTACDDEEIQQIQEQIRQRAYELYEARGCEEGHEWDDWFQAEAEITHKAKTAAA